MARPRKTGLDYYPKDVDFYDDFKIADLLNEYGPLGVTIYEVLLTLVYRNGYYLAVPLDKLAAQIVRIIGNRWIPKKDLVLQVIHSCADIGLLCVDLLSHGVITSAGIQKRYAEVTVRNKVDKSKYWLLGDDDSERLSDGIHNFGVNDAETAVSVAETNVIAAENTPKQRKENEIKEKNSCCASARIIREFAAVKQATPEDVRQLEEFVKHYGEERVLDAVRKAASRGGHSTAYIGKILQDNSPPDQPFRFEPTHSPEDIEAELFAEWLADAEDYLDDEQ